MANHKFFVVVWEKKYKRPRDHIAHLDNYRRTKIWALWSDLYSVILNCNRCIIIQKIINRERIEICTSCSKFISNFFLFFNIKIGFILFPLAFHFSIFINFYLLIFLFRLQSSPHFSLVYSCHSLSVILKKKWFHNIQLQYNTI